MPTIIYVDQGQPAIISSFQAKTALADAGLLDIVQAVIEHEDTPIRVKLAWQEGLSFRRDNPMIAMIAAQLEWSDEMVDQLFADAALISPDSLE